MLCALSEFSYSINTPCVGRLFSQLRELTRRRSECAAEMIVSLCKSINFSTISCVI